MLLTNKNLDTLSRKMNEGVSGPPSDFARRMLTKHGWEEGRGLGRNEDGPTTHIRVIKKEEASGIGYDQSQKKKDASQWGDQWW